MTIKNLKTIENLIEAEDPALYDEIDKSVMCHRIGCFYEAGKPSMVGYRTGTLHAIPAPPWKLYTTSLDAQAPLMPEDWAIWSVSENVTENLFNCVLYKKGNYDPIIKSDNSHSQTEPMARLLAIVRVWIWEIEEK